MEYAMNQGYADVDSTGRTELARFLENHVKKDNYRDLEELTGVATGTLNRIVNGKNKHLPELETLIKIATAFNLPLWRVVEMAGADVGMAQVASAQSKRLAALQAANPAVMNPIVERLLQLNTADLHGVLAYLEAVLRPPDVP